MSSKDSRELPDIGEVIGPLVASVPTEDQPLLVAIAERMAAVRYRAWADAPFLAAHRARLLACADREEEIASRIESLRPDSVVVQTALRQQHPDLEDLNRSIFEGRPLADQLVIQARGERLGAATWRAFAERAADETARACFLGCAALEEDSARVLEEVATSSARVDHLGAAELEAGIGEIRESPRDNGLLERIVRRPRTDARDVVAEGVLDTAQGLVGDNWRERGYRKTADGSAHPDMQLNIMNARVAALVARRPERWQLAGDQLFLDLDLSGANLPPGTRLSLGDAVIEVTAEPHTGCKKFVARFGAEAMKFVNSPVGRELNLRGINAKVIRSGTIRVGDVARKLSA